MNFSPDLKYHHRGGINQYKYRMQVYSRQTDCARTAVGHCIRYVGVSDHSLITELQTHKLIDLQGLKTDSIVNRCWADQSEHSISDCGPSQNGDLWWSMEGLQIKSITNKVFSTEAVVGCSACLSVLKPQICCNKYCHIYNVMHKHPDLFYQVFLVASTRCTSVYLSPELSNK